MNAVDFLESVSIFTHMKKRDLKRIAKQVQTLSFEKGEVIIREGEKGSKPFIIARGLVEVVKDLEADAPQRLHTYGPPSYFGEMAIEVAAP